MKTAAAMTRNVIVVAPEINLGTARQMMERHRIRHLPVVKQDRLVGILSDRDLLRYEGVLADEASAGAAMTPAPITCSIATTVSQVAQLMLDHKIDSIPVVAASGLLVGLVTSSDLLQLLVESGQVQALPFHYRLTLCEEDGMLADAV